MLHSEYDVIHVCCLGTLKLYIYDVYDMIHVHVCCLGTLMPYDVYDMIRVSIFGALLCLVVLTSRRLLGSHIRQCCFGIPVVINTIKVIKSTIQKKYTPSSHLLPIVYSFF